VITLFSAPLHVTHRTSLLRDFFAELFSSALSTGRKFDEVWFLSRVGHSEMEAQSRDDTHLSLVPPSACRCCLKLANGSVFRELNYTAQIIFDFSFFAFEISPWMEDP
jgi:hypothetical protein